VKGGVYVLDVQLFMFNVLLVILDFLLEFGDAGLGQMELFAQV
jgi:hypothetical protein